MTLNEALIASLKEVTGRSLWDDYCLWIAQKDTKTVWIHVETKEGRLNSYHVPLEIFKNHLSN